MLKDKIEVTKISQITKSTNSRMNMHQKRIHRKTSTNTHSEAATGGNLSGSNRQVKGRGHKGLKQIQSRKLIQNFENQTEPTHTQNKIYLKKEKNPRSANAD